MGGEVGPHNVNLRAVTNAQVPDAGARSVDLRGTAKIEIGDAGATAKTPPPPGMAVGKAITFWLLSIVAGSIIFLLAYVWVMENTAAEDIRRNYGKDLNREDVTLYLAQRLTNFSNAMIQAENDSSFTVSTKTVSDEQALIETLHQFPNGINDQDRDALKGCVLELASAGKDRSAQLKACEKIVTTTQSQGLTSAAAAFSFQMASEASGKILEAAESARILVEGRAVDSNEPSFAAAESRDRLHLWPPTGPAASAAVMRP